MRMLCRSILSVVFLVTLAQASPLHKRSAKNRSEELSPLVSNESRYSLPKIVRPNSYRIKLEPDLGNNFTFNGESNIDVIINPLTTMTIDLHAVGLEIEKEFTSLVATNGTTLKPTNQSLDAVTEVLTIEFPEAIETGSYTLNLRYTGKLKEEPKGFYRVPREIDGQYVWEALTQFTPSYARRAFPCFDEKAMTAWFSIWIKLPENYVAKSTALTINPSDDGDESWNHFISRGLESTDEIDFKVAYVADWEYASTTSTWDISSTQAVPPSSTILYPTYPSYSTPTWDISTTEAVPPSSTTSDPTYPTYSTPVWDISTTETVPPSSTTSYPTYPSYSTPVWDISTTETVPPSSTSYPTYPSHSNSTIPPPIPPTNQKCIHATYIFTCTQCRPVINISQS